MEKSSKSKNSKVKLKVVKKSVHMRQRRGLNRSNSSFNNSCEYEDQDLNVKSSVFGMCVCVLYINYFLLLVT